MAKQTRLTHEEKLRNLRAYLYRLKEERDTVVADYEYRIGQLEADVLEKTNQLDLANIRGLDAWDGDRLGKKRGKK